MAFNLGAGTDPCQLIAMDVNFNHLVDIGDALVIESVIAQLPTSFLPSQESWRFVAIDDCTSLPPDPLVSGFDEHYQTGPLSVPLSGLDFKAIKIGDVNMSVDAFPGVSTITAGDDGKSQLRNAQAMMLTLDPLDIKEDSICTAIIRNEEPDLLAGLQFTLQYPDEVIEIISINSRVLASLDVRDFESEIENGKIGIVWTSGSPIGLKAGEPLVKIIYKVKEKARNDIQNFSINSTRTEAIALCGSPVLQLKPIQFRVGSMIGKEQNYFLSQNEPNPFSTSTNIYFSIPKEDQVVLTIYDRDGRTIKFFQGIYTAGLNLITIQKEELTESGLYYYSIKTGDFFDVRRLIYMGK